MVSGPFNDHLMLDGVHNLKQLFVCHIKRVAVKLHFVVKRLLICDLRIAGRG